MVPYSELVELLEASRKVDDLILMVERLKDQQEALRGMFLQLMDRYKDLT